MRSVLHRVRWQNHSLISQLYASILVALLPSEARLSFNGILTRSFLVHVLRLPFWTDDATKSLVLIWRSECDSPSLLLRLWAQSLMLPEVLLLTCGSLSQKTKGCFTLGRWFKCQLSEEIGRTPSIAPQLNTSTVVSTRTWSYKGVHHAEMNSFVG
jgi:hypothetical protein